MKRFPVILVILVAVALLYAAEDPTAKIRASFDRASEAVVAGDIEVILKSTYPGLLERVGGPAAMRSIVVENLQDLERRKLVVVGTEIVSISQPLQAGAELHAIVRAKRKVKGPGGVQIQDTFWIAVSGDDGESWTFVDGLQLTPKHLEALFPDFNESLELPQTAPPVLEGKP